MTYDEILEEGEWLEDKGKRFSRYNYNHESVWVDHDNEEVIDDPYEVE